MLILLREMSQNAFCEYEDKAIRSYANENIESGRWIKKGAVEQSRAVFKELLPDGLNTKDNYLFEIILKSKDCVVGILWLSVEDKYAGKSAFIYDIEIYEDYRRKGYAKQSLKAIESYSKDLSINKIGLHVFNHNKSAASLYEAMGYDVVSSNMVKTIV